MVFTIMNPGDMFYISYVNEDHNKIDNTELYYDTDIYRYYLEHSDNDKLRSIIKSAKKISLTYLDMFLRECYSKLLFENMDDIIFDIISGSNSNDELIICLIAIEKNRKDIIEHLVSKGFNLNQMVLVERKLSFLNYDVLTYAVRKNNLSIVKYLVDLGASPLSNDLMALKSSCGNKTFGIFEYFLDLEMPYNILKFIFVNCCTTTFIENKIQFIKKIMSKGFNLYNISTILDECVANLNVDDVRYLINNGYTISSIKPLTMACIKSNTELIDFLLGYGLQPDKATLDIVFDIFDIPTIEIFVKHKIDLSDLIFTTECNQLINDLLLCGMNKDTLISLLLGKKNKPSPWFDSGAYEMMTQSAK
ncbi:putative ankyrin repeat protein [Tupanvirus deep ocean]|uniref:Ankyrin repeat protein n=2 Tax=Tupanvirus TaxID=2094720 RepID=A0AC62A7S8_9VIRU|nr:putative ankyrin repeat protein [Tupanvirus deep ocean]QKU33816.1 putative ankyrin repeat protein [Tupanvirus deep ocean]